jgi:glycosyltransferase involved in cell wall biosynthesis
LIAEYTHYAGFLSSLVKVYLRNMSKRFCNSCDQVITPSNPMKKILQDYGVTVPIEVVMTGIEPKNYKRVSGQENKQLREKYKIDPEAKICLYISRVAKEKNIDFLFKSFVKIQDEYPICHLLMVGGGPEEEWAKTRIEELGIKNKVTLTGMLPKIEANKLFGFGDIFTFPSYTETQGIVIAEAMASGTPPVAVGKMGPLDLVHDGKDGYLTKLSISDFSEKVLKLLHDDKMRDIFAMEGLKRVEEFSNETSVTKLISLYEKVLSQVNS